jgi:hypothetical protein
VGERLQLSDAPPRDARPASVVDLPGGGRLLVRGEAGTWIVGRGPVRRVGGPADQVAWSAFGRYLARARGGRLQAVALNGRVAWTQTYPGRVSAPVWSPDGYRIAFRLDGRMHVSSGDGAGAHPVRAIASARALHSLAVAGGVAAQHDA